MPETQLILSYLLGLLALLAFGGLALFAVAHAKSRIIREQRKALEAEQRLRLAQRAFTDNAHHELRTPLQVLTGHLQMLRDLGPGETSAILVDQALGSAQRLHHLVQGLLDLSSLGHGTLTLQTGAASLDPHLADLARRFGEAARAKGLAFQADLAPLPRLLVCDAVRLTQALEALLDNALGFTEHGAIGFRLQARPEGPAWHLRFEIQDQGPGLPRDWERLLRPFEQEDQGLRRRRGGLGIGLPLASGLVQLMGGRMGLDPLAKGTLAWVELSLVEERPTI